MYGHQGWSADATRHMHPCLCVASSLQQENYTLPCAVQVDRSKPAVDPTEVRQFGLVLSRFEFNGYTNPNYRCRRR